MTFNLSNIRKSRIEKLLDHNKADVISIVRNIPGVGEGADGDIAVGATSAGVKLFIKISGKWHSFTPDNVNSFENVMDNHKKKEYIITNFPASPLRSYDANSATNDNLSDVLGTLIKDLSDLGIIKLKQ